MGNKSSFKSGLVFGAILGGLAAYFLSPRSGKENREMAKKKYEELRKMMKDKKVDEIVAEIYGKASAEGKKLYLTARKEVDAKLAELNDALSEVDKEKYKALVDDVITHLKDEKDATKDRLTKLQAYLVNRWDEANNMAKEDVKVVVEKNKKMT